MQGFVYREVPESWYQIAWSDDLRVGDVLPLRYFAEDLVCYRGTDDVVRVMHAHCPHMGAHLGYGGAVEGDCLRCPFHGWKWGPDGVNVEVPYSAPSRMPNKRLRNWPVLEMDGVVLAWHSESGEPPGWVPAPFIKEPADSYWLGSRNSNFVWRNRPIVPQLAAENLADAAHFRYVHRAGDVPSLRSYKVDGPVFHSEFELDFGTGRPTTWATPNGAVRGSIIAEARGIGLVHTVLESFDRITHLAATTPIDADTADVRATTWVPRVRGDGSDLPVEICTRWVEQQNSQTEADLMIWENLRYMERPAFARQEAEVFRDLRRWASQFYRPASEKARVSAAARDSTRA